MVRFMNLVKNEYIKTFRRVSTWILIILVALAAVGFSAMVKIVQVVNDRSIVYYSDSQNLIEDLKNEINYLKQEKADGYEIDIERCNFMIDHEISYRDWRYADIFNLFEQKKSLFLAKAAGENAEQYADEEKQIQNQLDMLGNNNWKAYYTLKVNTVKSNTALSAEEKEANLYAYRFMLDNDLSPASDSWKVSLANTIMQQKIELLSLGADQELSGEQLQEKQALKDEILKEEYRLKNNIASAPENISLSQGLNEINFWNVLGLSTIMINVISLAIIITAGASIANEFSSGTIKFLLINPVKRSKIFLSKYVMILTLSVLLILGFYVVNVLCAGILFGFGSITAPYLYVVNEMIHQMPGLSFILWKYLLGSVNLVVMGTLAFAISSLLRNAALAIGISVFALLGGNIIMSILGGALKFDWARFLIFANVDLNAVIEGNTMFRGMTVGFSLAVIAVHMVVFFLTAWDGFMRRESI